MGCKCNGETFLDQSSIEFLGSKLRCRLWWIVASLGLIYSPGCYQAFKSQWSLYVPPGLTFTNSTFCPHSVFMCFVWIWEETAIISLHSIDWLVFITETECVYCAVRTGSLYTASLTFSNSTFCPHNVFMCFVWVWEQTAIISLYSINWLFYNRDGVCLLRGTAGYLNVITIFKILK